MADWYAATTGNSGNNGSLGSPWDIETALTSSSINPGDTLWLLEGTYFYPDRSIGTAGESGWQITLQGTSGSPIEIRPHASGRVIIDGGLHSLNSPQRPEYLHIYNLEVLVSENLTETRTSTTSTTPPPDLDRPWGGLDIAHGLGIKIIHCVVHANMQGIGFWQSVDGDSELYGNIIYDNGWIGSDRPHGHGIYTQNPTTTRKYVRNNILIANYSYNLHGFGTSGLVDNFTVEDNISSGGPRGQSGTIRNFMLGSQVNSSNTGHELRRNRLWHSNLELGRPGDPVDNVELTDNWVVLSDVQIEAGSTNVTESGTFNWGEDGHGATCDLESTPRNGAATPSGPEIFIEPSDYDATRAHIAVYNYFLDDEVAIDFTGFLTNGQDFYLLDPTDFYGQPVYANTYQGSPLMVPTGGKMFVPLVAIQAEAQQPVSVPSSGFMW